MLEERQREMEAERMQMESELKSRQDRLEKRQREMEAVGKKMESDLRKREDMLEERQNEMEAERRKREIKRRKKEHINGDTDHLRELRRGRVKMDKGQTEIKEVRPKQQHPKDHIKKEDPQVKEKNDMDIQGPELLGSGMDGGMKKERVVKTRCKLKFMKEGPKENDSKKPDTRVKPTEVIVLMQDVVCRAIDTDVEMKQERVDILGIVPNEENTKGHVEYVKKQVQEETDMDFFVEELDQLQNDLDVGIKHRTTNPKKEDKLKVMKKSSNVQHATDNDKQRKVIKGSPNEQNSKRHVKIVRKHVQEETDMDFFLAELEQLENDLDVGIKNRTTNPKKEDKLKVMKKSSNVQHATDNDKQRKVIKGSPNEQNAKGHVKIVRKHVQEETDMDFFLAELEQLENDLDVGIKNRTTNPKKEDKLKVMKKSSNVQHATDNDKQIKVIKGSPNEQNAKGHVVNVKKQVQEETDMDFFLEELEQLEKELDVGVKHRTSNPKNADKLRFMDESLNEQHSTEDDKQSKVVKENAKQQHDMKLEKQAEDETEGNLSSAWGMKHWGSNSKKVDALKDAKESSMDKHAREDDKKRKENELIQDEKTAKEHVKNIGKQVEETTMDLVIEDLELLESGNDGGLKLKRSNTKMEDKLNVTKESPNEEQAKRFETQVKKETKVNYSIEKVALMEKDTDGGMKNMRSNPKKEDKQRKALKERQIEQNAKGSNNGKTKDTQVIEETDATYKKEIQTEMPKSILDKIRNKIDQHRTQKKEKQKQKNLQFLQEALTTHEVLDVALNIHAKKKPRKWVKCQDFSIFQCK
ncbi:trichohyalin-like [Esox lucius]|uniref:trichohyalin-like n=1 Tax=Esox lucius TaxID=8010 RepID=UPI001476ACDB|nr:trichohyalin-like [Esox lucius]